jgi:pyruvate/2-oxoglutarate dehydrogenase complex dihydrolipoamide dehydrogenase (E3) component
MAQNGSQIAYQCYRVSITVVIGGGVAGLISVIVGAWLGKKCVLIERHAMGGDCLNTGCVPSKALIACARAAHSVKSLGEYGVKIPDGDIAIDFGFIMQRMREIRSKISHHDSVARYSREFCQHVFVGTAHFEGGNIITVAGDNGDVRTLRFSKAMIASGASAAIPDIPGLRQAPHLTNGNLFNLTNLPPRMIVIGCGPIGLEMAQSFARFGCRVVCLEMGPRLLPREDPDATEVLRKQLDRDGK